MILFAVSAACFLFFLLFELFFQSLDRLSPIKLRGLLEEEPDRYQLLAGKGEAAVIKTSVQVVSQVLILVGFWSLTRSLFLLNVRAAWLWSGILFLSGWLLVEAAILRIVTARPAETILSRLIPALSTLSWVLKPLAVPVRVFFQTKTGDDGPASEEEIQAYIDVGREEGILEKDEEKLLLSIVDFGDTTVKEVMTPRTDIVAIDEESTLDRLAAVFVESKYSRLPVYRGSVDTIVGMVHVKDAFEALQAGGKRTLSEMTRPVPFVPETNRTAELLREFQRRRAAMAIVVDEYGSVSGLVTIEDLLEEIVGEIADEHEDERDPVVTLPGGAWSVSARSHVDVVKEIFGRGPKEGEFDTVGGFLSARLGRIPRKGETLEDDGVRYTVEEADRRRVHRVRVEPAVAVPSVHA